MRVLHVEDDAEFAAVTADFLESHDDRFSVETVSRAREALDRLDSGEGVDCVVSDHDMPGMPGLALLRAVREDHGDLPFVLFTGKGSEAVASEAISAGVTEYLEKGAVADQFEMLAHRIERAVAERRAQDALEESERMFSTLVGNLPGMVYRCEIAAGWPMVYVSEGSASLTGYDPEALESGRVSWGGDVIHPEDRERVWEPVERAIEAREQFEVSYRILTADDEVRWVTERGSAVYEGGDAVFLEGFITDVTEQREREQRLEEFASVVSHDLRNPLHVIDGHVELARDAEDPEEHLDHVEAAVGRMDGLIEDLLALSRQGEVVGETEAVDVGAVAKTAWETVSRARAGLQVADPGTVEADPERLRDVFENLFRNAVEHGTADAGALTLEEAVAGSSGDGADGGSVRVRVGGTAEGFFVADDGPGIPEPEREAVFQHGYSSTDAGSGVGLAIVDRIAVAHGWEVSVTESKWDGARFEFAT